MICVKTFLLDCCVVVLGLACIDIFVYRSPVAKFLLEGGQTQSWLLGNSIISVTTSGGARVGQSGLCEKCLSVARAGTDSQEPLSSSAAAAALRRRHKSEAVRTCRGEDRSVAALNTLTTLSQDDIGLHRRPACIVSPHDSASDDVELMRLDAKKKTMDDVLISTYHLTFFHTTASAVTTATFKVFYFTGLAYKTSD